MYAKRWLAIAFLSVFGALSVVGASLASAQSYDAAETETIELINAYRQENGLGTLSLSAPLSVASERHSEDMGTYGFFAHDTVQSSYYAPGSSHAERIAQEGYDLDTFTAENLAYGQSTPQEVFEAWRNSPGHNAAMLGDYSVVGIGLVNVGGVPYWTTVFGAEADASAQPVGAAPSSGATPAEEPTATTDQYGTDAGAGADPVASEDQYDNAPSEDGAANEQYDAPSDEGGAATEQYEDVPENPADEGGAATEQYEGGDSAPADSAPADTTISDQYRTNADRFRAAADQYGEEARRAEREIAALQTEQNAATPAAAPVEIVGSVSPEPQISAPASAAQEIPVPSVEDAGAVQSTGQSGETSGDETPSEQMAAVGMVVLPDTGGVPLGSILGVSLVVCVLMTARRFIR